MTDGRTRHSRALDAKGASTPSLSYAVRLGFYNPFHDAIISGVSWRQEVY